MSATRAVVLLCVISRVLGQTSLDHTTVSHQLIAQASNSFTIKTYHAMKEQDGNICIAPFSLEVLLAMLYLGSRGAVSDEIQAALLLPNNILDIKEGFRELISRVETSEKLQMAAKMFGADNFIIKNTFISDAETYFHSGIDRLNFRTRSEEAVRAINSFVAEKTHNKITNLFNKLSKDTALVLVNALYFKAAWKHPLQITNVDKFFVTKQNSVPFIVMSVIQNFTYKHDEDLGAKILEIPYEGDFSMFIVLPDEVDGLDSVENKIAMTNFETITAGLHEVGRVQLNLPMFKIEMKINLKGILQKMGMPTMFEQNAANLSGIADGPMYVSKAIQKNYIYVDRKGTEAAAVTGLGIILRTFYKPFGGVDVVFKVDHPFLFMIVYRPINTVFFKGRCSKPEL